MAVPKFRMSRANTHARRSQWKTTEASLVPLSVAGVEYKIPRRLVKAVQRGYIDIEDIS